MERLIEEKLDNNEKIENENFLQNNQPETPLELCKRLASSLEECKKIIAETYPHPDENKLIKISERYSGYQNRDHKELAKYLHKRTSGLEKNCSSFITSINEILQLNLNTEELKYEILKEIIYEAERIQKHFVKMREKKSNPNKKKERRHLGYDYSYGFVKMLLINKLTEEEQKKFYDYHKQLLEDLDKNDWSDKPAIKLCKRLANRLEACKEMMAEIYSRQSKYFQQVMAQHWQKETAEIEQHCLKNMSTYCKKDMSTYCSSTDEEERKKVLEKQMEDRAKWIQQYLTKEKKNDLIGYRSEYDLKEVMKKFITVAEENLHKEENKDENDRIDKIGKILEKEPLESALELVKHLSNSLDECKSFQKEIGSDGGAETLFKEIKELKLGYKPTAVKFFPYLDNEEQDRLATILEQNLAKYLQAELMGRLPKEPEKKPEFLKPKNEGERLE